MTNVVFALVWESWRLSRRWYLWVLPVAFAFDYLIMRQVSEMIAQSVEAVARGAPPGLLNPAEDFPVLLAPGVFMINFVLAMFATLLAISLGNKSGFPLSFEFRLPVRTSVLVAVPMLTTAALCASLYVLPMLAVRLVYGVPIPLLPAGARSWCSFCCSGATTGCGIAKGVFRCWQVARGAFSTLYPRLVHNIWLCFSAFSRESL